MRSAAAHGPARSGLFALCALAVAMCDDVGPLATGETDAITEPVLVGVLDSAELGLAPPEPGTGTFVDAGVFLGVATDEAEGGWRTRASAVIRGAVDFANREVFAQCGIHVRLERAGVVALPKRLLSIRGNEEGSWGGHPPPGVEDSLGFLYDEEERLTADTRDLFGFGKLHTSPNTITAFTVDHITYFIGHDEVDAGGLSFPPVVYHHADDFPMRNSVLVIGGRRPAGGVPDAVSGHVLAHELAHMLLNSPLHGGEAGSLMGPAGGTGLDAEECARMRENNEALFGDTLVPDPGRPGGT